MFERFSDEARQALALAGEEAARLHHGWIGTEHLLLGVLCSGGAPARLLADFGVDAGSVRDDVVRIVGGAEDERRAQSQARLPKGLLGPHIPFTPRAKKALELTLREGIALGDRELRGEHLILGLLREGDGVAARMLLARGATLEAVRGKITGRDAA